MPTQGLCIESVKRALKVSIFVLSVTGATLLPVASARAQAGGEYGGTGGLGGLGNIMLGIQLANARAQVTLAQQAVVAIIRQNPFGTTTLNPQYVQALSQLNAAQASYTNLLVAAMRNSAPVVGTFAALQSSSQSGGNFQTGSNTISIPSGQAANPNNLLIGGGAQLQGNGTINGNVINSGGIVSPGTSPGQITIGDDFTSLNGTLSMEIAGTTFGSFDVLSIGGSAFLLGGSADFTFINGFVPEAGDTFTFLDAGDGVFLDPAFSFSFPNMGADLAFEVVESATGDLVLKTLAASQTTPGPQTVPEPSTFTLFGIGLLGLGLALRTTYPT